MKLRRAVAAAAVTAVMAPGALLVAPAAFAGEAGAASVRTGPTGSPSPEDTPQSPAGQQPAGPSGSASAPGTPSATATDPDGMPGAPTDGPTVVPGPTPTEDDGADEPGGGPAEPSATPSATPGDEPVDPTEGCSAADFTTSLTGLPKKIVAGSGWKRFSLGLDNSRGRDRTDLLLGTSLLYRKDTQGSFDPARTLTYASIQYFDGAAGKWTSELSQGGAIAGVLPTVEKGAKVSLPLRVRIDARAPAGSAVALALGVYDDGEHCVSDEKWYGFEVLAAGSQNPDASTAEPEAGAVPADVKPQGGAGELADLPVTGSLAATGSSSMVPVIGLVGGIAVVAGAGVVFAGRRRRSGAGA